MTGSFSRAHFSLMFYQQKVRKNEILKQNGISTNDIYWYDFLKVGVLNHLEGSNFNHPTFRKNKSRILIKGARRNIEQKSPYISNHLLKGTLDCRKNIVKNPLNLLFLK